MRKLCYEACIETQNDVTIVHGYRLWECIMMITCITCITSKLQAIPFSLCNASHIDLQQLHAWFLSVDNSRTETTPGVFSAMKHIYSCSTRA